MRKDLRVLALCLFGGIVASIGFIGTNAVADSFTDVPGGSFFAGDIDWLTDYDIANGFPDGTFDPEGPIKRQQAALWMRNLSGEIELVNETIDPVAADAFIQDADCPGDKRVVSGGGRTSSSELFITDSHPLDANTWRVRWESDNGASVNPSEVRTYALCVPRL